MNKLVALDIETTGFGANHRIVEIGLVIFDPGESRVLSEFETLINPLRNVPSEASAVHGLTAMDLSLAPTFEEISDSLLEMLEGNTILAHNASFDVGFLASEFKRFGKTFEPLEYLCTYRMTGQSLSVACEQISYSFEHHAAIEDAKASLAIWLAHETLDAIDFKGTEFVPLSQTFRTITRAQIGLAPVDRRLTSLSNLALSFSNTGAEQTYLGLLDAYLRDLALDNLEEFGLRDFAESHGIDADRELQLQDIYLTEIEHAALRDGIITDVEATFFNAIAKTLGFDRSLERSKSLTSLPPQGSLICVTGTVSIAGTHYDKRAMSELLDKHGYRFTDEITKKSGVALLLQESEGSQSSKVAKAQAWGIPRMVIANFVELVSY